MLLKLIYFPNYFQDKFQGGGGTSSGIKKGMSADGVGIGWFLARWAKYFSYRVV